MQFAVLRLDTCNSEDALLHLHRQCMHARNLGLIREGFN